MHCVVTKLTLAQCRVQLLTVVFRTHQTLYLDAHSSWFGGGLPHGAHKT